MRKISSFFSLIKVFHKIYRHQMNNHHFWNQAAALSDNRLPYAQVRGHLEFF